MKKRTAICISFLVLIIIGVAMLINRPVSDAVCLEIYIVENGFNVFYNNAEFGGESQYIQFEGSRINGELKGLIRSPELTTMGVGNGNAEDPQNRDVQKKMIEAVNKIRSENFRNVMFIDFQAPIVIENKRIPLLSLVNCQAAGLEAFSISELHLTRCTDMDWSRLGDYTKLLKIHIAPGDVYGVKELKNEGFFPEDFFILSAHEALQEISIHLYLDFDQYPHREGFKLTRGDLSQFEDIKDYVPFTLDEAKAFLTSDDKCISVLLEGD